RFPPESREPPPESTRPHSHFPSPLAHGPTATHVPRRARKETFDCGINFAVRSHNAAKLNKLASASAGKMIGANVQETRIHCTPATTICATKARRRLLLAQCFRTNSAC